MTGSSRTARPGDEASLKSQAPTLKKNAGVGFAPFQPRKLSYIPTWYCNKVFEVHHPDHPGQPLSGALTVRCSSDCLRKRANKRILLLLFANKKEILYLFVIHP